MPSEATLNCSRCGSELQVSALVCSKCDSLIHGARLEELAADARRLEAQGAIHEAGARWGEALGLLPAQSKQALWIQDHARQLANTANMLGLANPSEEKSSVFNLKSLISFAAFVWIGIQLYDVQFGLGFAALVLIHEMGHYIDIRLRGLPADMPIFLPGLGAFVRWRALGIPLATRAYVSLAGPLAGLLSAAACVVIWTYTGDPLFARLAQFGAGLTIFNLVPVWVLDGGQAVRALSQRARIALLTVSLLLCFVRGGSLFLAIVAGAVYQVFFNKESAPDGHSPTGWNGEPEKPSIPVAAYFIAMLPALALLLRLLSS